MVCRCDVNVCNFHVQVLSNDFLLDCLFATGTFNTYVNIGTFAVWLTLLSLVAYM